MRIRYQAMDPKRIPKKFFQLEECDAEHLTEIYQALKSKSDSATESARNTFHFILSHAEVKNETPLVPLIKEPVTSPTLLNQQYQFCLAAKKGNLEEIKSTLGIREEKRSSIKTPPFQIPDLALCWAAYSGHTEIFYLLREYIPVQSHTFNYAIAGGNLSIIESCFHQLELHPNKPKVMHAALEKAKTVETIALLTSTSFSAPVSLKALNHALQLENKIKLKPLAQLLAEHHRFFLLERLLKGLLHNPKLAEELANAPSLLSNPAEFFQIALAFLRKTHEEVKSELGKIICEEIADLKQKEITVPQFAILTNVLLRTTYALKNPYDLANNKELGQLSLRICEGPRKNKLRGALLAFLGTLLIATAICCFITTCGLGAPFSAIGLAYGTSLLTSAPLYAVATGSALASGLGSYALTQGVNVALTGTLTQATHQFWQALPKKQPIHPLSAGRRCHKIFHA